MHNQCKNKIVLHFGGKKFGMSRAEAHAPKPRRFHRPKRAHQLLAFGIKPGVLPDIDAVNDNRGGTRHRGGDIREKLIVGDNRAEKHKQDDADFQQARRADEKHADDQHGIEHQRAEILLQHVAAKRQHQRQQRRNQKRDPAGNRLIPRADFLAIARQMVR